METPEVESTAEFLQRMGARSDELADRFAAAQERLSRLLSATSDRLRQCDAVIFRNQRLILEAEELLRRARRAAR